MQKEVSGITSKKGVKGRSLKTNLPGREQIRQSCEKCRQVFGQEMLSCPERPLGRCPYVKQNLVREHLAFGWFFLLFSIIFLVIWINQQGPVLLLKIIGVLIGLVFFSIGLYIAFHTRVQLYNPNSKTRWIRKTLLGFELEQNLITYAEPVPTELVLSQPLTLPPSVTKLGVATVLKTVDMQQVVSIFRGALVGLLAQELISIDQYRKYVTGWDKEVKRVKKEYHFTTTKNADLSSIDGVLEREIINVLTSWTESKEAAEWPDGAPIYEIIRAIYGSDVASPAYWVVNLVAEDAVTQGWGQFKGWPRKRFEVEANHTNLFQSERNVVKNLTSQLAQHQPDLSRALEIDIKRAIESRERKSQDYTHFP